MTTPTVPLSAPLSGASLPKAVARFFQKYATFSGRASRSEYWWIALLNILALVVFGGIAIVGGVATGEQMASGVRMGAGASVGVVLLSVWFLGTFIPGLAVTVRRLHDANYSGLLILLNFIPWIGSLIVIIFTILPSNHLGARFDAGATPTYPPTGYPPAG